MFVGGCATYNNPSQNLNATMQSWVGHTEESLVQSWGIPTSSYFAGHTKFITYTWSNTQYTTRTVNPNPIVCIPISCPKPYERTTQNNYYCDKTFTIVNGRVNNWTWRGNGC